MKTYWTSGVMAEVNPRPGDKLYYRKEDVDAREDQFLAIDKVQKARIAELEHYLRALVRPCERGDGNVPVADCTCSNCDGAREACIVAGSLE